MHQQHPNVPQAHALKFRTVVRGRGGPKEAVNDIIDDAEELDDYAGECTGEEDRAKLAEAKPKWEREKVIAVAIGLRPTPAYEVEVTAVVQITGGFVGLQTQVHYVTRAPRGPATPPAALTLPAYPHHVVRVKNAGGLIIFRDVTPVAAPPQYTTLALGEEGAPVPPSPVPPPHMTTMMVGEEGAPIPHPGLPPVQQQPHMTTMMVGEEGAPPIPPMPPVLVPPAPPRMTTMMVGEEAPPTKPGGEEGGGGGGPFGGF